MYVYIYIYIYILCIYVCMHVCMYVYMYIYIYILGTRYYSVPPSGSERSTVPSADGVESMLDYVILEYNIL